MVKRHLTIRKLYEEDTNHFKKIKDVNLKEIGKWETIYPNHEDWINKVTQELKEGKGRRIAFGGFFLDINKEEKVLCCSAILKKSRFTPYLEIKNLIVFAYESENEQERHELKKIYQNELIEYIVKFAAQRGYPRLITEIFRKDKALFDVFNKNDFEIAGNIVERYSEDDEILYLNRVIDPILEQDPYDDFGTSKWIISNYFKCSKTKKEKISLIVDGKKEFIDTKQKTVFFEADSFTFFIGEEYSNHSTKFKFNIKNRVIVIEESYKKKYKDFPIQNIIDIIETDTDIAKIYIFDFSKENITKNIQNTKVVKFCRDELIKIANNENDQITTLRRFDFDKIGGILLVSNPEKFPKNKIPNNIGTKSIYLKLGAYGSYLTEKGMTIIFAYPKDKDKNILNIWGCAKLVVDHAQLKRLKAIKQDYNRFDFKKENPSDGDYLFKFLEENNKGYNKAIPIWDIAEFDKHNAFNASGVVVIYTIANFKTINNGLKFDDFIKDKINKGNSFFDFYLSKDEVLEFETRIKNKKTAVSNKIDEKSTFHSKFCFISASPINRSRLNLEHDKIVHLLKDVSNITVQPPLLEPDYISFYKKLDDDKPTIVHFAGHGDNKAFYLKDNTTKRAQCISNDKLSTIFKDRSGYLQLVIFISCFSNKQAQAVSKENIYAIGFNCEIEGEQTPIKFAETFYGSLRDLDNSGNIKKMIYLGCTSFLLSVPEYKNHLSVWKNGAKLRLEQLITEE